MLVLAGCTPGGQFDPMEALSADPFSTKKKLQGDREAVFPNGVPGAETGVPADLVKGYQPPPEQTADTGDTAPKPVAEPAKPKPKPKPKPKEAHAPAPAAHDAVWDQKSAAPAQSAWPAPAQQTAQPQSVWPAPQSAPAQQAAQPGQSIWPNPSGTPSH
ncbi:MAG TPA: hypothetical protein VK430_08220 [Xanthobacteraceae bacterium]|nr:hypothetical protein [Xanthobacteraceae bacterium]